MEPKLSKMEPFQILLKMGTWTNLRAENPNMTSVFIKNENFERSEGKNCKNWLKMAKKGPKWDKFAKP